MQKLNVILLQHSHKLCGNGCQTAVPKKLMGMVYFDISCILHSLVPSILEDSFILFTSKSPCLLSLEDTKQATVSFDQEPARCLLNVSRDGAFSGLD